MCARPFRRTALLLAVAALLPHAAGPARAGPRDAAVVAVLGPDGPDLVAAEAGARAALAGAPDLIVEALADGGTAAGLEEAVRRLKGLGAIGVVALPPADLEAAYRKVARATKVPWLVAASLAPDARAEATRVWHLAPSPAAQALAAADAMLAPLAARRVAVVHEASGRGRAVAEAFLRNLSPRIEVAGTREWGPASGRHEADALAALAPDWVYAAVTGAFADAFVAAWRAGEHRPRCLFADGNRNERWFAERSLALDGAVFLDGPDPELTGRAGEALREALDRAGMPLDSAAVRAFEGARRLREAVGRAGSARPARVEAALAEGPGGGVLGRVEVEPHGGLRAFPFTLWRPRGPGLEPWPEALLPAPGCGPPLGFRLPEPAPLGDRGKLGYVVYGEGEKRTIEEDLYAIGLSTRGADVAIDEALRDEVLGRAVRIAHRLFRREADGTVVPGWSWGMTFTRAPPPEDLPRSKVWLAIVAGDHPDAGGQVIGSGMVAVYSTFLRRTMYLSRRLDPPVSAADRPLLDGTYRWGEDRAANRRADEIRCLLDGFASAVGLTLAHEFGHLCGCGHDTEHPTSIMNVVAGAGASWESAVWIPSHQRSVTTALGIEGSGR